MAKTTTPAAHSFWNELRSRSRRLLCKIDRKGWRVQFFIKGEETIVDLVRELEFDDLDPLIAQRIYQKIKPVLEQTSIVDKNGKR